MSVRCWEAGARKRAPFCFYVVCCLKRGLPRNFACSILFCLIKNCSLSSLVCFRFLFQCWQSGFKWIFHAQILLIFLFFFIGGGRAFFVRVFLFFPFFVIFYVLINCFTLTRTLKAEYLPILYFCINVLCIICYTFISY